MLIPDVLMLLPLSGQDIPFLTLLGLGAAVGVLGGFFGVGGGWIVTPALNILGVPMPSAVGTGLGYIFGMSLVSAWKHRRRGNVEMRLGLAIGLSMMLGIQLGKRVMEALDSAGNADPVVRWAYVFFLVGLGVFMLYESLSPAGESRDRGDGQSGRALLQRHPLGPTLYLPVSDLRVGLVPLLVVGVFAGTLTGILGVGGGFLLMPIIIYLIGVPTQIAVGTSLLCVLVSSPFAVLSYSGVLPAVGDWWASDVGTGFPALLRQYGRVEFAAAGVMVLGAFAGSPLGVAAGQIVQGRRLRLLYACMIILGGVSVLCKQFGLDRASLVIIFGAAGGMCGLILLLAFFPLRRARRPDS
jgi:uncharacterized membrane protein YfcA